MDFGFACWMVAPIDSENSDAKLGNEARSEPASSTEVAPDFFPQVYRCLGQIRQAVCGGQYLACLGELTLKASLVAVKQREPDVRCVATSISAKERVNRIGRDKSIRLRKIRKHARCQVALRATKSAHCDGSGLASAG